MPAVVFSSLMGVLLLLPSPLFAARGSDADELKAPWRARSHVKGRRFERGYGLIDPSILPPEPKRPADFELGRFAKALHAVCDLRIGKKTAKRYAGWIGKYAEQFSVDPFVVSAFIRRQSGCLARAKGKNGVGLTRLPVEAHASFIREGRYRYHVWEGARWIERELDVSKFAWGRRSLRRPESAIYFASALLAIYERQARSLDKAFRQWPHRHTVSHLVWGDRVRGNEPEERIMRDRRRMIAYYTGKHPPSKGDFRGRRFRLPLDGAPRKITSGWNSRRGKRKRRRHRALDFYSHIGEPVRAIDDGKVLFAGYQRNRGRARKVAPASSIRVRRRVMGRGGLFVIINHTGRYQSGYFHLRNFVVRTGQRVKKGQLIAYVGRTGIKRTRPHLHFDLRRVRKKWKYKINAEPYFGADALAFEKNFVGKMVAKQRKRRRQKLLARRYAARKKAKRTLTRRAKAKKGNARRRKLRKAKAKKRPALSRARKRRRNKEAKL